MQEYARSVAAAAGWLRGEDGGTVASGLRMGWRRWERIALRRRPSCATSWRALERVRSALGRLRAAAARSGVLLAADMDDRFVQAFACAGGRVVGGGVCPAPAMPRSSAPVDRPAADGAGGQAGAASPDRPTSRI